MITSDERGSANLETGVDDLTTLVKLFVIGRDALVGLHGMSRKEAEGSAVIGATLAVDVRASAGNAVGIADENDTANSCQRRLFHLLKSFQNDGCTLGIAQEKELLVRTIVEAVLDDVDGVLHARGDVLVETRAIRDGLTDSPGAVGKDAFDGDLKHEGNALRLPRASGINQFWIRELESVSNRLEIDSL